MLETSPFFVTFLAQILLPSLFAWSLFLILFGLVLGFALGWFAKPSPRARMQRPEASAQSSQNLPSNLPRDCPSEETREATQVNQEAVQQQSLSTQTSFDTQRESSTRPAKSRVEQLPTREPSLGEQISASSAQLSRDVEPKSTASTRLLAESKTGFQSRQPIAKPLGEIERRRQRFEEAQREAEQKKR